MRYIQHHGASILHDFEDPFMRKESVRGESFKFKFISLAISTWAAYFARYTKFYLQLYFKSLLHGGEPIKYGSMMYVYGG